MSWKSTTSFLKKLTMDDYNKVLHDIDATLKTVSSTKYRYSHWVFMKDELNARKEYQSRRRTHEEEQEELERWTKLQPEAMTLLVKASSRELSEKQFTAAYRQLIGEDRHMLKALEREISKLDGFFRDVDPKKLVKFFAEVVKMESPEAIADFLDAIMLENLIPLMSVISLVEDAFWHNKLNEEQVNKAKRYIVTKYLPDYGSNVTRKSFTLTDVESAPNAYLDMEDLKYLVVEAKFMIDAGKSRLS